jgi:hypothetical protein
MPRRSASPAGAGSGSRANLGFPCALLGASLLLFPWVACGPTKPAELNQLAARPFPAVETEANAGMGSAQFRLGQMYRNGVGVARNDVLAYVWLEVACAQDEKALAQAGLLERLAAASPLGAHMRYRQAERSAAWRVLSPAQRLEATRLVAETQARIPPAEYPWVTQPRR